jgi:isoleucyl-tRNA synthetase
MSDKYPEYKGLDLSAVADEVLLGWQKNNTFQKSITGRNEQKPFVFYEGPPSANGMPGIHHVMARSIKDIFCRYKTLKGYRVNRKAGWDTHGLPIELGVEKELGITKEDIGKKISVDDYNKACRAAVMRYTDVWNDLTAKMGYWVDMSDPYITYENKYIESVWWLLQQLYNKNMLYKGYTIQPYSPAAGTGLSTHELNQPGCYRDVKDTSVVAQFELKQSEHTLYNKLNDANHGTASILAWTTTPWTLPSNTALAVGSKIIYVQVLSFNQYTHLPINVVLAKNLLGYQFGGKYQAVENLQELVYAEGDKHIPYLVKSEFVGSELIGLKYHQLLPYAMPMDSPEEAFRVIAGDFVTTEDGTGIVHIAPTFGADDMRVAKEAGVPPMLVSDDNGNPTPLVDLQGKFVKQMGEFAGLYVKNEYYAEAEMPEKSVDVLISIKLKTENRAFKVEKYEHSYPHCWRTDKPILYYPLDSWFIKSTASKERMIELNKTINWKPKATGEGRFGNWLENLNDWNLSRSRFWGIPIPIWRSEDGTEAVCIGSVEDLKKACDLSVAKGMMSENPLKNFVPGNMSTDNYNTFDLHKNYMDSIVLVSANGKPMKREADLIDVWFDSGAMPYAQWHYPFENKDLVDSGKAFPADFIAEGVDQTRGWFYTLHAIATMCFDSVAYKNVISNGLVLDKNGQKMSKRLGNAVDPFETLKKYGADAVRWYMVTNAQPWDNLKFDTDGIGEVQRKFFGTLYNTYSFFALYANIDQFKFEEKYIDINERPEIDRWILSELNTLILQVEQALNEYEPTRAGRLIQEFVSDYLSNWYVRLCRRRFWKGDYSTDKIAAYQTLYECLEKIAIISSPIAPFFMDRLFTDLNERTKRSGAESVHLADFPEVNKGHINADLEQKMQLAQQVTSLVLSLRKKEQIRVRQPLQKVMIPVLNSSFAERLKAVKELILSEVNVKEMEFITEDNGMLVKNIKPNFKLLGKRFGPKMKAVADVIGRLSQDEIRTAEQHQKLNVSLDGEVVELTLEEMEISTQDIPGWLVISENGITVALDITIDERLKEEGIAREFVNRIQNIRKDSGLEVTDKIAVQILKHPFINSAIENNLDYICAETLAGSLQLAEKLQSGSGIAVEIEDGVTTEISVEKFNN